MVENTKKTELRAFGELPAEWTTSIRRDSGPLGERLRPFGELLRPLGERFTSIRAYSGPLGDQNVHSANYVHSAKNVIFHWVLMVFASVHSAKLCDDNVCYL